MKMQEDIPSYSGSSTSSQSSTSSMSSVDSSSRELSKEEIEYLYNIPGKVEALLINKMHKKALTVIDGYLTKSPAPAQVKAKFFTTLRKKIAEAEIKKIVSFPLNAAIEQTFKELKSTKKFKDNLEDLFKTKPLGTSAAAQCLFTLIGIYSLQFLFLDLQTIHDIVTIHPAFKEMIHQKSISRHALGVIAADPSTREITQQVTQLCKQKILQFPPTAECLKPESLNGYLEDWADEALKRTYWQPIFTSESPSQEQLIKQKELNLACERGDIKAVKNLLRPLLKLAALPHLADHSGQLPLPTAVWGMNLAIVEALLQSFKEKELQPPSWPQCLAHNRSRWGKHFALSEFRYATDGALEEIEESPFLQEVHLKSKGYRPSLLSSSNSLWKTYLTDKAIYQDQNYTQVGTNALTLATEFSKMAKNIQKEIEKSGESDKNSLRTK